MARVQFFAISILILSLILVVLPILATRLKSSDIASGESGHDGRRCLSAGSKCGEQEECCTSSCRAVKNRRNKVCCVPEGSLCTPSITDQSFCCGAASCTQVDTIRDKNHVQDRKIYMCQVVVKAVKPAMTIHYRKKS